MRLRTAVLTGLTGLMLNGSLASAQVIYREVVPARRYYVTAERRWEARHVVRQAYLLAGTDALRTGPLERCFRDMHTATQHFFASEFASLDAGRALLAPDA